MTTLSNPCTWRTSSSLASVSLSGLLTSAVILAARASYDRIGVERDRRLEVCGQNVHLRWI